MEKHVSLGELIKNSGVHRLIICSELKISLSMLDDFINGNVKMPEELCKKLLELLKKVSES
ncbi:MAG: hypothetical protein IKB51_07125 [Clostridia bacterium]|nr:hypothetical protein [Clostridia bacterium]